MKKILIPIIGLLVLIILTPVIIGKMANSNIDKKIENLRNNGFVIKELKKDIRYLDSNRVFEVELNKNTKNKTWNFYKKFIDQVDFKIELKFRNLPITTADMDILVNGIKVGNEVYLKGLKSNVITKDFKTFKYKFLDYKDKVEIAGLDGVFESGKYSKTKLEAKKFNIENILMSEDDKLDLVVKDLNLYLFDSKWSGKKWKVSSNDIELKGINSEENTSTHLSGEKLYSLNDSFYSEKFGIEMKKEFIGFGELYWKVNLKNFKPMNFKNTELNFTTKWSETEYQKKMLGGGEISLYVKNLGIIPTQNNIKLVLDVKLDKGLFDSVTKEFDPAIVNKYFKDYKSHIEINNGEIKVNGNRI